MYNKKALRTIVNNLDKAKAPAKPKDIITDPMGQWKYPGQKTRIPGGDITMQGVSYPVWAQPNVGPGIVMQPGQDYKFPGADYVDETPMAKKGGSLKKYSRSLEAKNKIFADNPLTKKPKSKKKKIFDPTSTNYKNGGVNESPSLPLTAGRNVYETFAYGMYDRPGWKKQDGGVSNLEGDLISKVIMNRNKGVDFVDRAYALGDNPGTPMFNVPDDEQFGQRMSHKMAWGENDNGQAMMFPTVLNPNEEAIEVPNQYADYISSQGYKNATGMNQYQDGGEAWEDELTDEEIQAYRDAGYQVDDLPEAQTGGYFSYGDKKYMKKNGKWLVESNGNYVPLSKNVEARTAELNKNAKYVKPTPAGKSQYELDQEAKRANYFNPNYSIVPDTSVGSETLSSVAKNNTRLVKSEKQRSEAANSKKGKQLEKQRAYVAKDYLRNNQDVLTNEYSNNAKSQFNYLDWDKAKILADRAVKYSIDPNSNIFNLQNELKKQFPKSSSEQLRKYASFIYDKGNEIKFKANDHARNVDLKSALKSSGYYNQWSPDEIKAPVPGKNIELSGRMPQTVGEWGTRLLDIAANPLDAIHYGMSSSEEMPMNMYEYEKAKQMMGYEDGADKNMLFKGIDFASYFTPIRYAQGVKALRPTGESIGDYIENPTWETGKAAGLNTALNLLAFTGLKNTKVPAPISKVVAPITKNTQRFADKFYTGMGQGTINKYNPLNLIPWYGKKLSNPTVAAGNVLDDVVKSGNVVSSQSPLSKAYRDIIQEAKPQLKVSKKPLYNSGKSIFQLETRPNVVGSKLSYSTQPTSIFARTKGLNYNNAPASQIPLSDPGATLYRRLPFSRRFVRVDPIKLANNQAQWATRGTGLQNLIEKYGRDRKSVV